jgi:hypothetical protein
VDELSAPGEPPAAAAPTTVAAPATSAAEPDAREAVVRRLLERYLVEVVEAWGLCPWAHPARLRGELEAIIRWGPSCDAEVACQLTRRGLTRPGARVVMLVLPELLGGGRAIEALRDAVALRLPEAGVAAFGPHGALDSSTPARLVPLLRRSPDPMLQLVPFALLDELRAQLAPAQLGQQARVLAGLAPPPPPSVIESIARRNHAVVSPDGGERLLGVLAELRRDRAESYRAAGIRFAAG